MTHLPVKQTIKTAFFLILPLATLILTAHSSFAEEGEDENKLPEAGAYLNLEKGGKINVRIENNRFHLYFLDAEDVIQPLEYKEASLRYENVSKKDIEDTVRLKASSDGKYLTSSRAIRPPFNFRINIVLKDRANPDNNKILQRLRLHQ